MSEAIHIALDPTPCERYLRESFICEHCGRFHTIYRERTADDDAYVEFVRRRKAELATAALTESTDPLPTEPAKPKDSSNPPSTEPANKKGDS